MMDRLSMIQNLHGHPFVAAQIDDDIETGHFHYIAPQGAGHEPNTFHFWPAICLKGIPNECFLEIREHLSTHSLSLEHLEETDLYSLALDISKSERLNWNTVFSNLLSLPANHTGSFYCLYDTEAMFNEQVLPRFFPSSDDLAQTFSCMYVHKASLITWESMSDDELLYWCHNLPDFDEFPFTSYSLI